MSAFDTTTDTPSVSFTNSYGTAVLQPSASNQYVYGFRRTQNKRYLEYRIDDAGGDTSKLWVGMGNDPTAAGTWKIGAIFGSTGLYSIWQQPNVTQQIPPSTLGGLTSISTGDVYMCCVDFGGGTDHTGTQRAFTTTDGSGNKLLPVLFDFGKNGVWGNGQPSWYKYLAGGISGYAIPLVVRESTSASSATVSLRVVTTSFVYTIPTGFIAWGDGPDGGAGSSISYTIAWDPARTYGVWSLSGSNLYATHSISAAATVYQMVQSTPLPTVANAAGRRVIEFLINQGGGTGFPFFSLVDESATTSLTYSQTNNYAFLVGSVVRRTTAATSLTNVGAAHVADAYQPIQQYVVDHTNQTMWATNMTLNGVVNWFGTVDAARSSPYKSGGLNGFTLTDSIGFRWQCAFQGHVTLSNVEINVGQKPFMAYPLMPGVRSYDGQRFISEGGDGWKPGLASMCYSHSNLGIGTNNANISFITTNVGKFSGKHFFQIWHGQSPPSSAFLHGVTGMRPDSMTTLSVAAQTKGNLVWGEKGTQKTIVRYSITSNVTIPSISATVIANMQAHWESVAVDFDAGKIWFGLLDVRDGKNYYVNGGDPAAGTGEALTFTASTTLVPFTWLMAAAPSPSKPTIFVAHRDNVVDNPVGFDPWNGPVSTTATPSGGTTSGRVLWPYGVQT